MERSREAESILRELADLRERGFKEVTLLGQNVNSYNYIAPDGERVDFARLLAMVAEAAPDMRVRFTTSHPKDMSDDIIATIAAHDNICNHIHCRCSPALMQCLNGNESQIYPRMVS